MNLRLQDVEEVVGTAFAKNPARLPAGDIGVSTFAATEIGEQLGLDVIEVLGVLSAVGANVEGVARGVHQLVLATANETL